MYGFDIEGERRREAGFLEALRQRWEAEQRAKTIRPHWGYTRHAA
jgi:hypothetical protein